MTINVTLTNTDTHDNRGVRVKDNRGFDALLHAGASVMVSLFDDKAITLTEEYLTEKSPD